MTSHHLLFYPLIMGATEKLKLPLSGFKSIEKFTSWFVEGMKIVMRNGDVHMFKGLCFAALLNGCSYFELVSGRM